MKQHIASIETLGCKVNQYESSFILESLEKAGYRIVPFNQRADLYVVNSCAVTAKACYQTRQLLRRAQRFNPSSKIAVVGCYAQLEPDYLASQRLATHILGTAEKAQLLEYIDQPGSLQHPFVKVGEIRQSKGLENLPVTRMLGERSRALLRIQDGCDSFCTYCVVPWTRGPSRSLSIRDIHNQLAKLIAYGYQEVVLTGTHLGRWGKDLIPSQDLCSLLHFLRENIIPRRLRLSSIEPNEWSTALIAELCQLPCLCHHFHIPLQSGDRELLQRMGRPYTPEEYEELIMELSQLFPTACLGADVIVGFPQESPERFENTVRLIERLPLGYLHVFPFSPRPKTPASRWPGRTTGSELKRRTRILRELGEKKRRVFQQRFVGKWLEVLVESPYQHGLWQGTSGNYLKIRLVSNVPLAPGSVVLARVYEYTSNGLIAMVEREIESASTM